MRPLSNHEVGTMHKIGERQVSKFLATEIKADVFNKHHSSILPITDRHTVSFSLTKTKRKTFVNE